MSAHQKPSSERGPLALFRALPGDFAPRDVQDLMAYPFFSLAKTPRFVPIDFRMGDIVIRVEAGPSHGMATIWDADLLIWAASQITEARDAGLSTSLLVRVTPHEILTFIGRGVSARDYHRLKAALNRLQSTSVTTTLPQSAERRMHQFSWIENWTDRIDARGKRDGIDLLLPAWFYHAVLAGGLVLTISPAYFRLTGGLERWLYRLVRKHAGQQRSGWKFDFRHLHSKSASLSPFRRFSFELRSIARAQPLPGYHLAIEREAMGRELLTFRQIKLSTGPCGQAVESVVPSGVNQTMRSGTAVSCGQEKNFKTSLSRSAKNRPSNLESNLEESNYSVGLPQNQGITGRGTR